jgi:hypothetical protein
MPSRSCSQFEQLYKQDQSNRGPSTNKESMVGKSFASQHDESKRLTELKERIDLNTKTKERAEPEASDFSTKIQNRPFDINQVRQIIRDQKLKVR